MSQLNKKTTIKDVAAKAGVSVTTVSQILNHKGARFPAATHKQVRQAVADLGYVANFSARNTRLAVRRRTIGVLVPQIQNPFFANLFRGIQDYLYDQAADTFLVSTDGDNVKAQQYMKQLIHRSVDGFIIASQLDGQDPLLKKLRRLRIPYVLLDQNEGDQAGDQIIVNERQGGQLVATHLAAVKQGPMILVVPRQQSANIHLRIAAVKAELARRQVEIAAIYQTSALEKSAGALTGRQIMQDFATAPHLTVWAVADEVALGIIKAVRQARKQIPENVKLMGYDDTDYADYLNLTTIHQPVVTIGREAAALLQARLADPVRPRQVIVKPVTLVRRDSTSDD